MSGTIKNETVAMMQAAQSQFMRSGGTYGMALAKLYADGVLDDSGAFHEYPKDIHILKGKKTVQCSTEDRRGKLIEWEEVRDDIETITVHSEEEEDRVLNGGKTAAQIEDDRQSHILQAKARGIKYDPTWSLLRLQKELGIPVAAEQPGAFDEVAQLEEQVAKARRALELRAELAALNAQLAEPDAATREWASIPNSIAEHDDIEAMRLQLQDLGVKVDGRWSAVRLRQELDRATAPAEG